MKKSQLRNIIKESIKELMTEQTVLGKPIMSSFISDCNPNTPGYGSSRRMIVNDNGVLRNPQVGDIYCSGAGPNANNWSTHLEQGCHMAVRFISTICDGCPPPIGNGVGQCGNQCMDTPITLRLLTGCDDDSCCGGMGNNQICTSSCSEYRYDVDYKFDKPTMIKKR